MYDSHCNKKAYFAFKKYNTMVLKVRNTAYNIH